MSSSNWPPALKTYVNDTFAKCTDSNRVAVEAELKKMIFDAFQGNKLWTTDWTKVELKSLSPSKKRKAFAPSTPHSHGVIAPANNAESDRREKRARRFEDEGPSGSGSTGGNSPYLGRVGRAGTYGGYAPPEPAAVYDSNVIDWDRETVVGTSFKLEKPFLRLTSVPDPTTIRPLPVLQRTLDLLKSKWKEEGNYGYICDQFKSMRQDLTVQRIKNDFTCTVYEIHARIALEKGDLGEFNQCQGQLRELYKHGLTGHDMEFLGYRILYLIFARNPAELNSTIGNLTEAQKSDPSVEHALAVRHAVSQGNYTKFFRLFLAAPKMGAYLMDHFIVRERVQALVTISKAYLTIPLSFITSQLAFDTLAEADTFLADFDAATYKPSPTPSSSAEDDKTLDCKLAQRYLVEALAKLTKVDLKGQI